VFVVIVSALRECNILRTRPGSKCSDVGTIDAEHGSYGNAEEESLHTNSETLIPETVLRSTSEELKCGRNVKTTAVGDNNDVATTRRHCINCVYFELCQKMHCTSEKFKQYVTYYLCQNCISL